MDNTLCGHAGSCDENMMKHGGAFCANLRMTNEPISSALAEAVARVEDVYNRADYGGGHVITADNLKLDDLRTILDALTRKETDDGE